MFTDDTSDVASTLQARRVTHTSSLSTPAPANSGDTQEVFLFFSVVYEKSD